MEFSSDVLDKFRALIALYQAIGRGEEVEWVCPCPGDAGQCPAAKDKGSAERGKSIPCTKDRTKICEGPGGPWRFVRLHALGRRSKSLYGRKLTKAAIQEQAQRKAEAWVEWLAEC